MKNSKCALCGEKGRLLTASSHLKIDDSRVYVNTTYTLDRMSLDLGKGAKYAGICQKCDKNTHGTLAGWPGWKFRLTFVGNLLYTKISKLLKEKR